MKIGILQTGHAPDELRPVVGDFAQLFERLLDGNGFDFATYSVVDMQFPASITDCDGWLITGSKHGAYEDHPFIPPLESLIREIYAAGIPLVGICFGHQIIAQALGGKVEKFAGGWAVGRTDYTLNGEKVTLNAWHQDQVTTRPDCATVIGENDFCANAALVYDNRIFTIQPHPEFDRAVIDGLVTYRGPGNVPDPQLAQVRENLEKPVDSQRIAAQIVQFFKTRKVA
ncbi:GMP synthase (glutamine-hydrolysing) [Yoonia tamlensis]|uniref:GMP synthase (Glutamine-hydrolysing) n=1 Tax=Yoonia tamlensis TaxID=390270 RepID=A0A1I6FZN6_9RHOB|nr:type 1 glutamine amidotransferase [Yoonia tamlensis]SFR35415.1 GMP synthase (glutamine-hydrolysing) [Yoonia tamlensis]